MKYDDPLYGTVELPDYIGELMETPLLQRLKDISQAVLPQSLVPWKYASRFEHCVGVCHLMNMALEKNKHLGPPELLLVSALLHDAGNPALSHLSEPFLRKQTGKDGESFLEDTISRFASLHIFETLGISAHDVVKMVTGNLKPLSVILHGSMDADNLDNVGRYWFARFGGEKLFDAELIASSFRFRDRWMLDSRCMEEAAKWQVARARVYGEIYKEYELNANMMIYRAVYLAEVLGEIKEDFFHFSDTQAVEYLLQCNEWSSHLARRAKAHQWYPLVYSLETTEPTPIFAERCKQESLRSSVADYTREQLKIPASMICAYAGSGRDVRRITLPFIQPDGSVTYDQSDPKPIYRLKIYLDPDYAHLAESAKFWAEYLIS
jgi:HD superfamily phosphohydrolase